MKNVKEAPEFPVDDPGAIALFVGKTIKAFKTYAMNYLQFNFTDGRYVVLHIDCCSDGLPDVLVCTSCALDVE